MRNTNCIIIAGGTNTLNVSFTQDGLHLQQQQPSGEAVFSSPLEVKLNAVKETINILYEKGLIKKKQDFAAIKRIVDEMGIFERFTNTSLLELLQSTNIATSLMPTESAMKKLTIGGSRNPNWTLCDTVPVEVKRINGLGSSFKELYTSLLEK